MKKMIVLAVCMLLVASAAFAASIVDTKHDLGTGGTANGRYINSGTSEICVFCHTPHGAGNTVPLWNRTNATGPFTMYTSATFTATTTPALSGASLACMGCHDGTLAISTNIINQPNAGAAVAGANTAGVTADKITGLTNLGTDLSNDHPVSFTYDAAVANQNGMVVPAGANHVFAGGAKLIGTSVECASCHDVHDNTNIPFLRGTMARSALCQGCHQK